MTEYKAKDLKIGDRITVELEIDRFDLDDEDFSIRAKRPTGDDCMWFNEKDIKEVEPKLYNIGDIISIESAGWLERALVVNDTRGDNLYVIFSNDLGRISRISKRNNNIEFIKENKISWE